MIEVVFDRGVQIPAARLWLDPEGARDFAFISHAHSDHTGRHGRIVCTPATERLMRARMGDLPSEFDTISLGEEKDYEGFSLRLIPAGHVLGSAQLLFRSPEGTLLYTGDFKLRRGLSSERAEAVRAETLIMETTYGLPRYRFPPAGETIAAVVRFCVEAVEDGETPVLLGYALGKGQEILSALAGAGLPIMLHNAILRIARIYEEFGIAFPPYATFAANRAAGHVVVCPPQMAGSKVLRSIRQRRVAALTGWALDPATVHRMQVDAAFPLSDHADYDELWQHVEAVGPRRVLTLHGFAQEFARDLRAKGIEAWALTGHNQLEIALDLATSPTAAAAADPGEIESVGFNAFCLVAEAIRGATGKLEKMRLLGDYLRPLDAEDLARAAVWLTGRAFPQSSDQPLNVGFAVIRRALELASGLSVAELRAIGRQHNDSGLTAAEAMQARPGGESVPLAGIAGLLESLRAARGPLAKVDILRETLGRLAPLAAGYLVRIITGDLRIGLKEGLVEEALARVFEADAGLLREANMLLGDIGRAARLAREGRLHEAELAIFHPVKCMLASPEPDAAGVWERLGASGSVWLEDKLDGIRAQLHAGEGRAEIYSRDSKRITATFPEIAREAAQWGRDAIFDGEILGWQGGRALSFFELQKRLGRREGDLFLGGDIPVSYLVFDLLRLDGVSLLRRPLAERHALLEELALSGALQIAAVHQAHDATDIEAAFLAARRRGNEGLMAKDPASLYTPGRRGLAWIKLKKEFATLDVVVVKAEYGHGRRSKVLSDYTFAIRDEETGALLPIGKAYSGLTDVEIATLTEEFLALAIERRGNRIDVEPKVVLEVAFDAIQPSDRHASGLALRFPRIKNLRRDKSVAEIDTLATARKLAGIKAAQT